MKSLYQRQFLVTAGLLLLAFLILGSAFAGLSYQYMVRDKQSSMERNASYIAAFTASYLAGDPGSTINDPFYQAYVLSLAQISESTVILCENSGEIVYAASKDGKNESHLLGQQVPQSWRDEAGRSGKGSWRDSMGGLLAEKSLVTLVPILQRSILTGTTYQRGLVLVASDNTTLTEMWQDLAAIFLLAAIVVLVLASLVSSVTAMQQTKPLKEMAKAAGQFGKGEMEARVTGCEDRKDEVGELAEAFNAMADAIAVSEEQRKEFIANVSHELKTPMTTIAGFADGILDGTIPPEKQEDALKTISSETRRLSRLVRRMLDLSRLRAQETVTAQERFDVSELLLRTLVSLEGKINDRDLDVETDLPEGPVMVWGDPDGITQVCYNLLDNAIKFAAPGTALGLGIRVKGEKAYVSVKDTGETIPPEELGQIFDRFHKTDRSRSVDRDGVGLGLYIVKTILNAHREDVTVTSEEGVTTFTFTMTIA